MRNTGFLVILLVLFFFIACRQRSEPRSGISELLVRKALDSIHELDNLITVHQGDSGKSLDLARRSVWIAKASGSEDALLKAFNIMGNACSLSMMDSAFYFYSKALAIKPEQASYPEKPMLLYNVAMLHVAVSNFKNAIVLLDSALRESEKNKNYLVASNALNALGTIFTDLGNDGDAKKMYDSAFQIASRNQLSLQTAAALGNLAKMEQDSNLAHQMNQRAIQYLKTCKDGAGPMASIYINYGLTLANPDSAIACYMTAIRLIGPKKEPLTLLAAYNNLVYGFLEKGEVGKARRCLEGFAFPLAKETGNMGWMANLYDTYADVLSAEGSHQEANRYEKKAIELMGQADKQAADKQVRLLGVMLDLKNKETIARAAQQEADQTKSSFASARFWFAIFTLCALLLTATLLFILVRNIAVSRGKLIAAAKKIIMVEENEMASLGRDLHDLTGHKLLNFSNFLEMASFDDPGEKSAGMNMLADLQEQLRKLSHRFNRNWLDKFSFHRNVEAMCRENIRHNQIDLSFTQPEFYPELTEETKIHLFRIIQELLTNAVKYAKTARIALAISRETERLILTYADDGKGFDPQNVEGSGIGIINIYERVRLMNGKADLDTRPGFGVSWEISIPVKPPSSILVKLWGEGS